MAFQQQAPFPMNPQGPYGPGMAYRPPMAKIARRTGAPLAALIVIGVLVFVIIALIAHSNPVFTIVGLVCATVAISLVILAYLWLDRWEPEPPRLLLFAFLWGAGVSVAGAYLLETLVSLVVKTQLLNVAVGAPIIEEGMKGLFLVIMLTGVRKLELNSLTDCLVYAGICAAGFAWAEDIKYFAGSQSGIEAVHLVVLRLAMGPFAHPLFTSMTAVGIFLSLRQRTTGGKALTMLGGYVLAVCLHAMWNGSSTLFNGFGYFIVYALVMIPAFAGMIVVAVQARKGEQQMVLAKLPAMAQANLIRPADVPWLHQIKLRRQIIARAAQVGGPKAAAAVKSFAHSVVELSFIRDRIDRGLGTPDVMRLQEEGAQAVIFTRQQAGILDQIEVPPPGAYPPPPPYAMGPGPRGFGPAVWHPHPPHPQQAGAQWGGHPGGQPGLAPPGR